MAAIVTEDELSQKIMEKSFYKELKEDSQVSHVFLKKFVFIIFLPRRKLILKKVEDKKQKCIMKGWKPAVTAQFSMTQYKKKCCS